MRLQNAAQALNLSNAGYTQLSAATAQGRFADVPVSMSYQAASTVLNFSIPALEINKTFSGNASREISEDQLEDYLKSSDVLGRIMHYQAKHSATSGITGVGGAIPMAAQQDFSQSFDPVSQIGVPGQVAGGGTDGNNLIGIGLGYASYNVDGSGDRVKATSLPLSYTIRNDIDPRRQLVFSLPLANVKVGEANTYQAGFGVAYRYPLTDRWTITPGVKYSVVGSVDRATVSTIKSASLMSTYAIPLDGSALAIGNMIGRYQTGKFSRGDYEFNPDIKLTMARNGVMYSMPTSAFGGKMAVEFSLIDTRYLGDKPFVKNSQEVGITLGTNRNASNARSYTRIGLTYTRGQDLSGVGANIGYWF